MAKSNGKTWLLRVCGVLIAGSFGSGFGLLWNVSVDVSAIAVAVKENGERLGRIEIRSTYALGQMDRRVRNLEIGQ